MPAKPDPKQKAVKKISERAGRKPPARPLLQFRIHQLKYDRLKEAAANRNVSVSEEAEIRLDRSFEAEDRLAEALGGSEFRSAAIEMAAAFSRAVQHAGREKEGDAKDLLRDPDCYRSGLLSVVDRLINGMPRKTVEEMEILLEAFQAEIASAMVKAGLLKFDFKDGRGPVGSGFLEPKREDK